MDSTLRVLMLYTINTGLLTAVFALMIMILVRRRLLLLLVEING